MNLPPTLVTIGLDYKGNAIQYLEYPDGSWLNLYAEILHPADFLPRHFSSLLPLTPKEHPMPAQYLRASKRQCRLRLALIGPAGSGKTFTSLRLAAAFGGRIAVIDTERGSASKYAHRFTFDVFEPANFAPEVYIEAIHAAETAGYDVLIIDSLSHAWSGKGGILEFVDNETRRSPSRNAYTDGWRKATPRHNDLVETMLQANLHLIVTMRSKTEYILEKDEKGRTVPRKVGLQPIQREGLEFEFDVVGEMTLDNEYIVSKTRCEALAGQVIPKPGEALAETLKAWLTEGAPILPSSSADPLPAGSPSPAAEPQLPGSLHGHSPSAHQGAGEEVLPSSEGRGEGQGSSVPQSSPIRKTSWTPAQIAPILAAGLAQTPAQVSGALNLSTLPDDAAPAQCLTWATNYALSRTEGLPPDKSAARANSC